MQAPFLLQKLFPSITWHKSRSEKKIYLTFDDGPIPQVTPWVLDTLDQFHARATFFCIGDNVRKHPEIYKNILARGHKTGNHTFHHLNGWKEKNARYFADIEDCEHFVKSKLFRPPYGKITPAQVSHLKKKYTLVMWDVISKDYKTSRSPAECMKSVIRESKQGSIIVFHDSLKAENNLRAALPGVLEYFSKQGFEFATL